MPNWVLNGLIVEGKPADVQRFASDISRPTFVDCSDYKMVELVPMPTVLEGTTSPQPHTPEDRAKNARALEETGFANWLEWQKAHWGTRWGDSYLSHWFSETGDRLVYKYLTPWSPLSHGFCAEVQRMYPMLGFTVSYVGEEDPWPDDDSPWPEVPQ